MGRVCRQKGTDLLLDAYQLLRPRHDNLRLVILRPHRPVRAGSRCRGLAGADRQAGGLYVGPVAEERLAGIYNLGDIFVMPTRQFEMFGMAAVEALACGKPVVASDQGGLRETVPDRCGARFVPGDSGALALAIEDRLRDGEDYPPPPPPLANTPKPSPGRESPHGSRPSTCTTWRESPDEPAAGEHRDVGAEQSGDAGPCPASIVNQTFADWELILIDDGSTDGTVAVAREFARTDARIRLFVDGCKKGLPTRLNESIDAGRGDLYARMDGDDVAYPRRLERQVDYLEAHPEVDLVGSWAIVFDGDGTVIGKRCGAERHEAICARPHAGFPLIHPTFLGRSEYFRRNRYRSAAIRCEDQDMLLRSLQRRRRVRHEGLSKSQDQDLLIRSYESARFANVPEILLGYRESGIDLKKILTSRDYFVKSLWYELRTQGHSVLAARGVVEQALKALGDVIAVKTGLNYRLLRHRALDQPRRTSVLGNVLGGPAGIDRIAR